MKIKITNQLTSAEIAEIRELQTICNRNDGLKSEAFLSSEINYSRHLPSFFICFNEEEIVGFLTAFMPEPDCAELTAFTHPKYRKKGIFKKLFAVATNIISGCGIGKFQFCLESNSSSGFENLKNYGEVELDRSEYTLAIRKYQSKILSNNLRAVPINSDTIDVACDFGNECYGERYNITDLLKTVAAMPNREGYIMYHGDSPVGFFMLLIEQYQVIIHGVIVKKELRGKGYGKLLMDFAIKRALQIKNQVSLDVDSENPAALSVYRWVGFTEENRIDYYNYYIQKGRN